MKYIMFVRRAEGVTAFQPVVFGNHLVHADVANAMLDGPLQGYKVRSAGEVYVGSAGCSGHSETLGVKSHKDDTGILMRHDYGGAFG